MILVDTSVWLEVFRRRRPLDLEAVAPMDAVATCLPVVQEVLQGFRDERAYRLAREAMLSFPMVESSMTASLVEQAVALYRSARRSGLAPRSSTDCRIATCALRNDLEVLHRDRDYALLARVSPLRQRRP